MSGIIYTVTYVIPEDWSSGIRCVDWYIVINIHILGLVIPWNGDSNSLLHLSNYLPIDTVLYPSRLEYSSTPPWEHQISKIWPLYYVHFLLNSTGHSLFTLVCQMYIRLPVQFKSVRCNTEGLTVTWEKSATNYTQLHFLIPSNE